MTMSRFDNVEDWQRTRKKWCKWTERDKDKVIFRPFVLEDYSVVVFHSSTHEDDIGGELPADEALDEVLAGVLA